MNKSDTPRTDASPSVNPWVSVEKICERLQGGKIYLCYTIVDKSVPAIGEFLFFGPINGFDAASYIVVTHVWDESIIPIPRP